MVEEHLWLIALTVVIVGVVFAIGPVQTRTLVENWVGPQGVVIAAIVAGVLLAAATFVVIRQPQNEQQQHDRSEKQS